MKKLAEQADFDIGQRNATKLSWFDRKPGTGEFSDRGRADIKVRPNDPRFADNAMADDTLNEFADDSSLIDRLHQMLNNIPVSDQQIKGGVALTQDGKMKAAARLGIGPKEVDMYINQISQQLRDQDENDTEAALAEQYYNAVNVIDETDNDNVWTCPECGHEIDADKVGDECPACGTPTDHHEPDTEAARSLDDHLRTFEGRKTKPSVKEAGQPKRPFAERRHLGEEQYSYEPDALGSVTVRNVSTGKTAFIQGAAASRLLAQLKTSRDHDAILAPLVEALDDTPSDAPVSEFWDEIHADSGSYNFQWKLNGQHGTGTVQFRATSNPMLHLVDVRDADGNEIHADDAMQQELLHQARDFIGQE